MRRLPLALALAVIVACAVAIPGDAAKRSECQRLTGKDLAPARSVKLASVPNPEQNGDDLVGCVLPRGRLRTIASKSDRETAGEWYDVGQVNGRIVLVEYHFGSQYGSGHSTAVWDLRGGGRYTIAGWSSESEPPGTEVAVPAAFITPAGRTLAAITTQADGAIRIAAFAANGARRDLDVAPDSSIDPSSLSLRGNLASWTRDGAVRTGDLKTAG